MAHVKMGFFSAGQTGIRQLRQLCANHAQLLDGRLHRVVEQLAVDDIPESKIADICDRFF